MIIIGMLLCDRKKASQLSGSFQAAASIDASDIPGGIQLYINIETEYRADDYRHDFYDEYGPLLTYLRNECPVPWHLDRWRWDCTLSSANITWRKKPEYDQDQARLLPICIARNMARAHMLSHANATHLLFIDADVIVEPDGLKTLLSLKHPLTGGLVPGRGDHKHVFYVFGKHGVLQDNRQVLVVNHGTCGYLLIERTLLSTLAFRAGLSREDGKTILSEDPAFASDAFMNGFDHWWIHTGVRAQHWHDPHERFVASRDSIIIG